MMIGGSMVEYIPPQLGMFQSMRVTGMATAVEKGTHSGKSRKKGMHYRISCIFSWNGMQLHRLTYLKTESITIFEKNSQVECPLQL
eukprot:c26728_g2_i2 orf=213-470(+)